MSVNRRRSAMVPGTLTILALALTATPVPPTMFGIPTLHAQAMAVDSGIRDALQRYATAMESLDAEAVKKVQPAIPTDMLSRAFREMRELKVTISDVRVLSENGTTARVSCRVNQMLTPRVGSKQTTTVIRVLRLRRTAEVWVIDEFER